MQQWRPCPHGPHDLRLLPERTLQRKRAAGGSQIELPATICLCLIGVYLLLSDEVIPCVPQGKVMSEDREGGNR